MPKRSYLSIVRVAGVAGDAMAMLSGASCRNALLAYFDAEVRLANARATLKESLYLVVSALSPSARRLAIEMKRACFNERNIGLFIGSEGWEEVLAHLREQIGEVLGLEQELQAAQSDLDDLYDRDRGNEMQYIRQLAKDPHLFRGIALASPELALELDRLSRFDCGRSNKCERKAKRATQSLLRYISRAALKVSPYSTLTLVGIGIINRIPPCNGGRNVELLGEDWSENSLFRIKRSLVDQFLLALGRHPEIRRQFLVTVNNTVEVLGPGYYRFLRPLTLVSDKESGTLRISPASQVKVKLKGPLADYLLSTLCGSEISLEQLSIIIARNFFDTEGDLAETRERVAPSVARLIDIGFLEMRPPWPSFELRLEKRLGEFLSSCHLSEELRRIGDHLLNLVCAGDAYPRTQEPHLAVASMHRSVRETWEAISSVSQTPIEASLPPSATGFFEDVFVSACDAPCEEKAILSVREQSVQEVLRCGNAVWRIFHLFNPRFNFLYALAGLWRVRWPTANAVPFLELFAEAQPIWRDYITAQKQRKNEEYTPFLLPEVKALSSIRQIVGNRLQEVSQIGPVIDIEAFEKIARILPDAYNPIVGCCVFIQPANRAGDVWVLNRIFEGTGKYIARFTACMEEPARGRFMERMRRNAVFEVHEQRVEILDLLYSRENTVNLHLPQTPKVLEIPGEHSHLPGDRRLSLSDLIVRLDAESAQPIITDCSGTRYLPCVLSPVGSMYMPVLLKFLSIFGPAGYIPNILPSWSSRTWDGMLVLDRLTFGSLIFRRKRWIVPREKLPNPVNSEKLFFREINACLRKLSIHERVFWIEPVKATVDQERYKPQFIDFSSPSFVALLQSQLAKLGNIYANVTFEEVIPERAHYPLSRGGQGFATEIILDSLMERECEYQSYS